VQRNSLVVGHTVVTHANASVSSGVASLDPAFDFDEFLRVEWPRLVRLAYVIVGSETIAEELVQDAFLVLHAKGAAVENPAGFVRTVLVNRCRSSARRRAREPRMTSEQSIISPEIDQTIVLVRGLSPKYRAVLVLRYYEDMSIDEIARVMKVRPGTVKSLLHRALKQLRAQMKGIRND
jgi:RNA polymerase sigma factor (sigma-70 family)